MSKPKLDSGLEYFPLDVHFINDDKIQSLIYEIGYSEAVSLVITLYSMIYENNYYIQLDKTKYKILSVRLNIGIDQLKTIINSCCEYSIFNENLYEKYGILTSKRIQLTYIKAAKRRKEIPIIQEYKLFEEHCLAEAEINSIKYICKHRTHYSGDNVNIEPTTAGKMLGNSHRSPQSKVKESKVNKNKGKEKENPSPDVIDSANQKKSILAEINKVQDFADTADMYRIIHNKYGYNITQSKIVALKRYFSNKQIIDLVASVPNSDNFEEDLTQKAKEKSDKTWNTFIKRYPNTKDIIKAKQLFLEQPQDIRDEILGALIPYSSEKDARYVPKALRFLEDKAWEQYV